MHLQDTFMMSYVKKWERTDKKVCILGIDPPTDLLVKSVISCNRSPKACTLCPKKTPNHGYAITFEFSAKF